jgi:hypothetical protein
MITYRITLSKKPSLRLWRVEDKYRQLMAKVDGKKAALTEEQVLRHLPLQTYRTYRDGRIIYAIEEESAVTLLIALKGIAGLRKWVHVTRILEAVHIMDRGEIYWWYSLYLKVGHKAIQALRMSYLEQTG